MFAPTIFSAARPGGAVRLALLRATDLTIAALTLESYCLADVAPGAAAELVAADVSRAGQRSAEHALDAQDCFPRTCDPRAVRTGRAGPTAHVGRRPDACCPTPPAPSAPGNCPASRRPRHSL